MATETVLKVLRTEMGMSQTDLANRIGRVQAEISLIERGELDLSKYPIIARDLSEVFHVPEGDLQIPYVDYVRSREVEQQSVDR